MSNHGQGVGEALHLKFTSEKWFEKTGDKYSNGYIITPEEFSSKHFGMSAVPIHIDDETKGEYECVCEYGVEVYN